MKIEPTSKIVGSPSWYVFYGLFLGWACSAGVRESERTYLFAAGLLMVFLMGGTEVICRLRAAKRRSSDSSSLPAA